MKKLIVLTLLLIQVSLLNGQKNFSFIYLPDIHLRPDSIVVDNFRRIVRQVNKLHPDFVLTGGDMIYTAKTVDDKKAANLFDLMDKEFRRFKMPVYYTIGNHEHVGIEGSTGIDSTNINWGKRLWEKRYEKRYYSFIYEGWKFFVLDGIRILPGQKGYTGDIDPEQIEWIKRELASTGKTMPIAISIHTPFINPHFLVTTKPVMTAKTEMVLNMFAGYNLKLLLEGHTHLNMNLYYDGIHYLSGGSTGYGTDENDYGFYLIRIRKGTEKPEFIRIKGEKQKAKDS